MQLSNIFTIKGKIASLILIAILGFLSLAAVNHYFNSKKERVSSLVLNSQLISHMIQKEAQEVTRYQLSPQDFSKQGFTAIRNKIARTVTTIAESDNSRKITEALHSVRTCEQELVNYFAEIRKSTSILNQIEQELISEINTISNMLQQTKDAISAEEVDLLMDGGNISDSKLTFQSLLKDLIPIANQSRINFQNLILHHDQAQFTTTRAEQQKKLKALNNDIESIMGSIRDKKFIAFWGKIKQSFSTISGLEETAFQQWNVNKALEKKLGNSSSSAQDAAEQISTIATKKLASCKRTARNTTMILVTAILTIFIAVSLIIAWQIVSPLKMAVNFAADIANGDFSKELIQQKDEIGQLSASMNNIVKKTGSVIKGIVEGVDALASSSTELSAISEQIAARAKQTTGKAETVATAAEKMSVNMNSVAAAAEQAATNVNIVATATDELTGAVNEIAENTAKASAITGTAVTDVQAASEKVGELGRAADEIGKVTETITEISDQTNLLALNATIEAARAGEAGKGFAVVANEIKELAKQTAEATGEIRSRIEGIQSSTRGTVAQITQISSVINEVNTIVDTIATAVEEQTATTGEIAANMNQATMGLQEVTENIAQSSAVSGEIACDILDVKQESKEMSNAGVQILESVQELSRLAEQLRHMSSGFNI